MNISIDTILLYTIGAGFISIIYGFLTGKHILSSSAGNTKNAGYCFCYSDWCQGIFKQTI